MTSYNLSSFAGAGAQFFDDNGNPLTGGKVYTYAAGTTTLLATYTTSTGAVANTNPIILDAAGRTPNEIWLTAGTLYKFIVQTSVNVLVGTYDGLPAINDPYSINSLLGSVTGTNAIAAVATPSLTAYAAGATYAFIAANSNTAAATLSIDGLATKSITKNGSAALTAGDIQIGKLTWVQYDGTTFQLINNIIYGGSITNGTIVSLSTPLGAGSGGTGLSTLTANSVLLGNGISAVQLIAPGTAKNVLTSNGTTWASTAPVIAAPTVIGQVPFSTDGSTYTATAKIVAATAITVSGTTVDFTSIPTWVKRVTVILSGVSTNGSSEVLLQIGAGSVVTSGYASGTGSTDSSGYASNASTAGFTLGSRNADLNSTRQGSVILHNVTGTTWVATVAFGSSNSTGAGCVGGGTLALSGALDRVRLTTAGGVNTFDAGIVNIFYE
jgi:hypothetical protein